MLRVLGVLGLGRFSVALVFHLEALHFAGVLQLGIKIALFLPIDRSFLIHLGPVRLLLFSTTKLVLLNFLRLATGPSRNILHLAMFMRRGPRLGVLVLRGPGLLGGFVWELILRVLGLSALLLVDVLIDLNTEGGLESDHPGVVEDLVHGQAVLGVGLEDLFW